jgi:hypothetical protein
MTPAGHRDKERMGESWEKVPWANRSMVGRQAREWDRGGRELQKHGSHRKQ